MTVFMLLTKRRTTICRLIICCLGILSVLAAEVAADSPPSTASITCEPSAQ